MMALNHSNIVNLFETTDTEETFLAMEHVSGGIMVDYLQAHGHLTESEAQGIFRQQVSACTTATRGHCSQAPEGTGHAFQR